MEVNNLYQQIIFELIEEGLIPVEEGTFLITPKIKSILKKIPLVKKSEFLEKAQVGDIVISFTEKRLLTKYLAVKISANIMAATQGSPYTSSKIVLDNKIIAGYGVTPRDTLGGAKLGQMLFKKYIRWRTESCLIRVKTSDTIRKKAAKFVKDRMGLTYDTSAIYKSIWNRLTKRKLFSFFKSKSLEPEEVKAIQTPLFCSTIISVAYLAGGFTEKFNNKHPYDVWPRDFMLSTNTKKICRIEYK